MPKFTADKVKELALAMSSSKRASSIHELETQAD